MQEVQRILAGAEPFFFEGSSVGVLLCHGYTGSPHAMRYLGEQLNRRGGLTVSGALLAGHGVSPEVMGESTAQDWINSVDEELASLREKCSKIFIVGLSMGGCLALLSAARHRDIAGIVPINACLYLDSPGFASKAYDTEAPSFLEGVGSDIKQPGVTELAYKQVPVASIREFYGLMATTRDLLKRIKCPVLILQSTEDHVVPPSNGDFILSKIRSSDRNLIWLKNSYHVATLDYDKDFIVEKTLDFIAKR